MEFIKIQSDYKEKMGGNNELKSTKYCNTAQHGYYKNYSDTIKKAILLHYKKI